jgi:hypothetical protein
LPQKWFGKILSASATKIKENKGKHSKSLPFRPVVAKIWAMKKTESGQIGKVGVMLHMLFPNSGWL